MFNADHKAFNEAYGIALWKADNQKRGINPGSNLGAVDISVGKQGERGETKLSARQTRLETRWREMKEIEKSET